MVQVTQRTRRILHTSQEVTRHTPVASHPTRLLTITTPLGARYLYTNPFPLVLKLFATGGVQIPATSTLLIAKRRPGEDFPTFVRLISYAAYFDLTEAQQRDERFAGNTRHDLGADIAAISNPEHHELQIWVDSPVVVALAEALTRFETTVLEEPL